MEVGALTEHCLVLRAKRTKSSPSVDNVLVSLTVTDYSPLHKSGTGTESTSRERGHTSFMPTFIVQDTMPKWDGILKAVD